ncbi:MAG: hypothetical protein KAI41_03215, partial [Hyphomicrobiaceae bacterium]|nr:hypothetical protein [Hyphomicrobiaceae bacterium]
MGSLIVNQQGTGMKQVAYFVLVAAAALAAPIPAAMAGPGEGEFLLDLLTNRVPPGVDAAARIKAGFLEKVARGELACGLLDCQKAT